MKNDMLNFPESPRITVGKHRFLFFHKIQFDVLYDKIITVYYGKSGDFPFPENSTKLLNSILPSDIFKPLSEANGYNANGILAASFVVNSPEQQFQDIFSDWLVVQTIIKPMKYILMISLEDHAKFTPFEFVYKIGSIHSCVKNLLKCLTIDNYEINFADCDRSYLKIGIELKDDESLAKMKLCFD